MSNTQDAMNLLFPAQRQQVLAALLLQPGHSLHLRELARLTGSHAGTLGRELGKLAQAGLLLRTDQGNQARYSANVQHPLFPELSAMFRKTHGVVPALRTALEPLAGQIALAFVYGSLASDTATQQGSPQNSEFKARQAAFSLRESPVLSQPRFDTRACL